MSAEETDEALPRVAVRDRILSSDWLGVFIVAAMCVLKGVSYLPPFVDVNIASAERWAPVWWWAVVWAGSGALGLVAVMFRRGGPAVAGLLTAVIFLWGVMYEYDFIHSLTTGGAVSRGYANGGIYIGFAAILWWAFRRGEPAAPWMLRRGDPRG